MSEKKFQPKRLSTSNTKQEMLSAYNELQQKLQERREADLKPEERVEEKLKKQVVEAADSLSTAGTAQAISTLKSEIGALLSQLSERLEEEVYKYRQVKKAVEDRESELKEIYEIQKSASSLTALIETQHQMQADFEDEMATRKEELARDIQTMRAEWEMEKKRHESEIKDRDAAEQKRREREKEEYLYSFQRDQQVAQDRFQDEKTKLEREIQYKREEMERELAERERAVVQSEAELNELRKKSATFPKELESSVNKAVRDAVERVQNEAKTREELLKKESEGERNVLHTRLASLEGTVKEQQEQIVRLSQQSEKAYGQVQDIAMKAIEGSAHLQSLTGLQQLVAEQTRKQTQDK